MSLVRAGAAGKDGFAVYLYESATVQLRLAEKAGVGHIEVTFVNPSWEKGSRSVCKSMNGGYADMIFGVSSSRWLGSQGVAYLSVSSDSTARKHREGEFRCRLTFSEFGLTQQRVTSWRVVLADALEQ